MSARRRGGKSDSLAQETDAFPSRRSAQRRSRQRRRRKGLKIAGFSIAGVLAVATAGAGYLYVHLNGNIKTRPSTPATTRPPRSAWRSRTPSAARR
ncbi:hypothetical protein GXW82_29255 [Streptacidiphilus sp. 4-A2]|nr:hypothetical protein [Streptacidiphilus sp. 4-A2]